MKICLAVLLAAMTAAWALAQDSEKPVELEHVDVTNVDTGVNPCDNFFQYVCNKPIAANPIPPDQLFWGGFGELYAWNRQVLRQILEKSEGESNSRSEGDRKIGDLYASCMNQATAKANDLPAIQPLLTEIGGLRSKRAIAAVLADIQRSYGQTWNQGQNQTDVAMFGYGPQPDYNDVRQVVAGVDQGGLGMWSRDFYLKNDDESKVIRGNYVKLIGDLLKLSGESENAVDKDVATILRLEAALAEAQMNNVDRRDPNKTNNRFTLAQLRDLTPEFDWDAYLKGIGAPVVPLYEVSAPDFFRALNKLLAAESLNSWKVYLRWHLLLNAADYLGNPWRDANFEFFRVLTGQQKQPPDWRRCTDSVDLLLGQLLGQAYVAQVFPQKSKERALTMVKDIEAAMSRDIDSVGWMQPETKRQAHLKLNAVMNKIGYPDHWIDYSSLTINRESYPANVERGTAFELKRQLRFVGKPLDRTQWGMTPPTVNAYEDPQQNTINFPAGMLQPVYFDAGADDVINYGAEGSIIGHELTHDFDDQGRKFDLKGNLYDWWTPEDAKEYDERGACLAKEYTGPVPGIRNVQQNGKLTQGEDTADNGGIYLALSALTEDLKQQGKTLEDKNEHGLSNLQRFFIAYGAARCDEMRPETERTLVLTDVHSIPELRVNNVLGNMPEFQQAFSCKAGQPMVHAARCRVW